MGEGKLFKTQTNDRRVVGGVVNEYRQIQASFAAQEI